MANQRQGHTGVVLLYAAMLAASAAAFWAIATVGNGLVAPVTPHAPSPAGASASHVLWHLLLALATVVTVGRLLGRVFAAVGQPAVIGEVVGGILLGPSLLGQVAPGAAAYLLPPDTAPYLGVLAQLGVIVYMFVVGLELNTERLRGHLRTSVATSHASIVVPFVLGSGLALYLYPRFSSSDVPFVHFALFLGIAMSVTAFPVLARILTDRRIAGTRLGVLALTCAAVDDITAWCLLAFVVGVVQDTGGNVLFVALAAMAFIAVMVVVVRPLLERLSRRLALGASTEHAVVLTLVAMLAAAVTTEAIGVHAIFGPFILGAMIRHDSELARALHAAVGDLVIVLLLPAFFAFTGMRTQIALLGGSYEWLVCLLVIVVATAGKFGGTLLAARSTGLDWQHAAGLGILMNTRGLMELIVLNVGLDLGVISPTLFTILVVMALVTTMMTTPVLNLLFPGMAHGAADSRMRALAER